jgi:PPP family 3-phenylpropionic acid transporter
MVRFAVLYFLLFTVMATVYPYFQVLLRVRGFSEAEVGYLLGFLSLAGVLGPMLVGPLADRLNKHRFLLSACLVVFGLMLLPLGWTTSFVLAAGLVVGIGLTCRTTIPLADTLAAGQLHDPVHEYGRVRTWGSVGFVVTLLVVRAFTLIDQASSASMIRAMLVATGLCLGSSLFIGQTPRATKRGPVASTGHEGFGLVFWLFIVAAGLQQLGMSAYYSFFTLYLGEKLGMANGAWVWALGTMAEIPMLFFAGRIIRRLGLMTMLGVSMLAVTVRFLILGLLPTLVVVLPSQAFHAMTFGLFHAASIEFLRRQVEPARRGLAMTLYMSFALALPSWIGSSIGGVVIENWGYSSLFLCYAAAPVVGILLIAVLRSKLRAGGWNTPQQAGKEHVT